MGERYISKNQPASLPFLAELSAPVHARCIRNKQRGCRNGEADLSAGVRIEVGEPIRKALDRSIKDFMRFMSFSMGLGSRPGSYPVALRTAAIKGIEDDESYQVEVKKDRCKIVGVGVEGIRRALIHLEDEMSSRRGPFLPEGTVTRECRVKVRISRSPYATYRFGTGWELENDGDFYPDEYLNRLAHAGINAIWVAGFFQNLIATKSIPELGPKKTRLGKLRSLVEKAALYGIKVYFFCMEPRIIRNRKIFEKYPDIRGAQFPLSCSLGETALCTSAPRVQSYLREASAELFRSAPGLAGIIDIFAGERATNCWFDEEIVKGCPRCSQKTQWEVLSQLIGCLNEGMKSVSPDAEFLAWDYSSISTDVKLRIMENASPDIVWLGCFEHGGRTSRCGKKFVMDEYSLSYAGPSEPFKALAAGARKSRRRIYAKLQIGTTYEQSSLPYIPVPSGVFRKFHSMRRLGVDGAMLSWIIGGFPSLMLKAAGLASFCPVGSEADFIRRLAAIEWGEEVSAPVAAAWRHFFKAYSLYPAMNDVFYYGPITRCPAYHLRLDTENRRATPYNFGITADRDIQPFEDNPTRWLGIFTEKELISCFRSMAEEWGKGLRLLKHAAERSREETALRQLGVAKAVWIQFRSCANVIEFYTIRNLSAWREKTKGKSQRARMRAIAIDEISLGSQMIKLLRHDPTLGFQSELYYFSFSENLIAAKIRHTQNLLKRLRKLTP